MVIKGSLLFFMFIEFDFVMMDDVKGDINVFLRNNREE